MTSSYSRSLRIPKLFFLPFLGSFYRLSHHTMLDHFSIFMSHFIHNSGYSLTGRDASSCLPMTHKTGMSSGSPVFRNDLSTVCPLFENHAFRWRLWPIHLLFLLQSQLYIGTTTSHVGCYGHTRWSSCLCNNFSFSGVVLYSNTLCFMPLRFSIPGQQPDISTEVVPTKTGLPFDVRLLISSMTALNFSCCFKYQIFFILSDYRFICRYNNNIQFVNFPHHLFCFSCTCHP